MCRAQGLQLDLLVSTTLTPSPYQVLGLDSSQEDAFEEVAPLVHSALDGYNACIVAYGQTGAGKTFTMEG